MICVRILNIQTLVRDIKSNFFFAKLRHEAKPLRMFAGRRRRSAAPVSAAQAVDVASARP